MIQKFVSFYKYCYQNLDMFIEGKAKRLLHISNREQKINPFWYFIKVRAFEHEEKHSDLSQTCQLAGKRS